MDTRRREEIPVTRRTAFEEERKVPSRLEKALFVVTVCVTLFFVFVCVDLGRVYAYRLPGTFFELAHHADHGTHDHSEL